MLSRRRPWTARKRGVRPPAGGSAASVGASRTPSASSADGTLIAVIIYRKERPRTRRVRRSGPDRYNAALMADPHPLSLVVGCPHPPKEVEALLRGFAHQLDLSVRRVAEGDWHLVAGDWLSTDPNFLRWSLRATMK